MSDLEKNPIKDIIEGDFAQRVHEVSADICSFDSASQQIEEWRLDGRFSVFNAGTYDILTLNHILGLVQCRTIGAMALLGIDKIETKKDQHVVHDLAASDSIHLMVTLDTNRALEEGKSRRPEKGGAPKPTLDNAVMTVKLQPDLVVVNSESLRTVADMERFKEEGLLPNTQIAIIREDENQYYDPILGGPVKTTSIIKRVRS